MLATGGTLAAAIRFLTDRGADDITAVTLLAAPEGIEAVERELADLDVGDVCTDLGDEAWRASVLTGEMAPRFIVQRLWFDRPVAAGSAPFVGTAAYGHLDNVSLVHDLEDGAAFEGTSKYPNRVKCALLGWKALKNAVVQTGTAWPADDAGSTGA